MAGRHHRPSNTARYARQAAFVGATGAALVALTAPMAVAAPAEAWDAVADCESGGNPTAQNPNSSASGLYQIIDGTWKAYGGLEYAPRAKDATPEQQRIVAERVLAGQGPGAWAAGCGDPLIGQPADLTEEAPVEPVEPTPPPAAPPAGEIKVVVETGDTLSELAPVVGAPSWPEFYEQNRDVVGENPHLIFPGQELTYVGGLPLPGGPPVQVEPEAPNDVVEVVPPVEVEQAEAAKPAFGTATILNSAGPVAIKVQEAADAVFTEVRGASLITIGGTRASARDPRGHPSGNALDYMVLADAALGDAIVQFHIANWDRLGVEYVIWQQRILMSPGGAWKAMEDRGSATQNHFDHVHVNYR